MITLHQANADDDWLPEIQQLEARKLDTDTCWQEVKDEWMEQILFSSSFLDQNGFRFEDERDKKNPEWVKAYDSLL